MSTNRTFRKLEKEVNRIAQLYFNTMTLINKNREMADEKQISVVNQIINAYELLELDERKIINNEFFCQDYPFWWKSKYSKEDFKVLKFFAMSHFVEVYQDGIN